MRYGRMNELISSMDLMTFSLISGEKPNVKKRLSETLETNVDEKYNLSPRACDGILRRAERRGKSLPVELEDALRRQASDGTKGPEPVP